MYALLTSTLLLTSTVAVSPLSPRYEGNCQAPQWAPDGSKIAYEVNYHDRKVIELYLITASGQVENVLPAGASGGSLTSGFSTSGGSGVIHELSWSPASYQNYVYSASDARKDYNLHLKGGTPVATASGTDGAPAWSPSGNHIVFTSARTGQGDLYLLDVRDISGAPKRLTNDGDASELYAAWSPNGKSLAYVGHSNVGDNLYYISDVTKPKIQRLTRWKHMQTRPSFSPDGKYIAFYSNHKDPERFDLWVTSVTGTPKRLKNNVVMNSNGPVWYPSSDALVVVADEDEQFDPIYRVTLTGAEQRLDTGTVGNGDHDLATLGDGRSYLALSAQGSTDGTVRDFQQIYVIPLPD